MNNFTETDEVKMIFISDITSRAAELIEKIRSSDIPENDKTRRCYNILELSSKICGDILRIGRDENEKWAEWVERNSKKLKELCEEMINKKR